MNRIIPLIDRIEQQLNEIDSKIDFLELLDSVGKRNLCLEKLLGKD